MAGDVKIDIAAQHVRRPRATGACRVAGRSAPDLARGHRRGAGRSAPHGQGQPRCARAMRWMSCCMRRIVAKVDAALRHGDRRGQRSDAKRQACGHVRRVPVNVDRSTARTVLLPGELPHERGQGHARRNASGLIASKPPCHARFRGDSVHVALQGGVAPKAEATGLERADRDVLRHGARCVRARGARDARRSRANASSWAMRACAAIGARRIWRRRAGRRARSTSRARRPPSRSTARAEPAASSAAAIPTS